MDLSDFELSEIEVLTLIGALSIGHGFTRACNLIQKCIIKMSYIYVHDPAFKHKCDNAVQDYIRYLLKMSATSLKDRDFKTFMAQNGLITRMTTNIVIWEQHMKKIEVNKENFLHAVHIYKYPEEVATAIGMDMDSMYQFLKKNPDIYMYLETIGWIQ